MPMRITNAISEKFLLSMATLSSVGCGFWFGRLAGISGLLAGLVLGFFLPISISIVITSIFKFFINIKTYEMKCLKLQISGLFQKAKNPWFVWFVFGAVIGISTGVYLGLKFGEYGIVGGAAAGFISYYFISLIILKIIKGRKRS